MEEQPLTDPLDDHERHISHSMFGTRESMDDQPSMPPRNVMMGPRMMGESPELLVVFAEMRWYKLHGIMLVFEANCHWPNVFYDNILIIAP